MHTTAQSEKLNSFFFGIFAGSELQICKTFPYALVDASSGHQASCFVLAQSSRVRNRNGVERNCT